MWVDIYLGHQIACQFEGSKRKKKDKRKKKTQGIRQERKESRKKQISSYLLVLWGFHLCGTLFLQISIRYIFLSKIKWCPSFITNLSDGFLSTLNKELPNDPAIPSLGTYPEELKTETQRRLHECSQQQNSH